MTGLFITFEGGEGSGKSTQIALLADYLRSKGKKVSVTREPGGTPGAEAIRRLVVEGAVDNWDAKAETLLFLAARQDHVTRVIQPALAQGQMVLCDRFMDSTFVYQGIGKGLGLEFVRTLHQQVMGHFGPTHTLLLDIDPAVGLKRAGERKGQETRFENMDFSFHTKIRNGFLELAKAEPKRIAVINADQSTHAVQAAIHKALGL